MRQYVAPRITVIKPDDAQLLAGSKWRYWRYAGDEYFERDYDERQSSTYEKIWKFKTGISPTRMVIKCSQRKETSGNNKGPCFSAQPHV